MLRLVGSGWQLSGILKLQSGTSFTVTSGNPTWTLSSGLLPPGLILAQTGTLAGTPITDGKFTFVLQATIANVLQAPAVVALKNFEVTIAPGPLGFLTASLPDGLVGSPYSQVVRVAGGAGDYRIAAAPSTLPPGITFIGNQLLTGTPTTAGTYAVQFTASDGAGATATRTIPLVIAGSASAPSIQAQPSSLRFTAFVGAGLELAAIIAEEE